MFKSFAVLLLLFVVGNAGSSLRYFDKVGRDLCQIHGLDYFNPAYGRLVLTLGGFNEYAWRVKEVRIHYKKDDGSESLERVFLGDKGNKEILLLLDWDGKMLFEFIYVDDTMECIAATFPVQSTGNNYQRATCSTSHAVVACPKRPNTYCEHLYVDRNSIPLTATSQGQVYTGFQVTDCDRSPVFMAVDSVNIDENGVALMPAETKAVLARMDNSERFVQLMVGMCPRTLVVLDELISSLHDFVASVAIGQPYIALSVFDGARGFVDLLPFTKNITIINQAIDDLRIYDVRDSSCNLKESVFRKFQQLQSLVFGQPWDRLFYVIFSASLDITNFMPDNDVAIPFSSDRHFNTYMVAMNIPESQVQLFSSIGNAGFWNLASTSQLKDQFTSLARPILMSMLNEYLYGYCSAARTEGVYTKMSLSGPTGSRTIQHFSYNAGQFKGKCNIDLSLEGLCSNLCSAIVTRGTIICSTCVNESSIQLGDQAQYQVLLRYPAGENITLRVPVPNGIYSVYARHNNTCNPLLYDTALISVIDSLLPLPGYREGDLLGLYIDFHGRTYNGQIKLAPYAVLNPPMTQYPPIAQHSPSKMNVPHSAVPHISPQAESTDKALLPTWAIAFIVIALATVAVVALVYFLHKRGLLDKLMPGKASNQKEYKHLDEMEDDLALDLE